MDGAQCGSVGRDERISRRVTVAGVVVLVALIALITRWVRNEAARDD